MHRMAAAICWLLRKAASEKQLPETLNASFSFLFHRSIVN
jgi:hypothetical protein